MLFSSSYSVGYLIGIPFIFWLFRLVRITDDDAIQWNQISWQIQCPWNAIHFLLDRIDGCPAGSQSHGMSCQENILGNCRQILYPEFLALSLCHTGGISADKDEERCLLDILCMILIGFCIFLIFESSYQAKTGRQNASFICVLMTGLFLFLFL